MKVIIGVDGSTCAQVAVDLAAGFVWPPDSTLRLVGAVDPAAIYGPFVGFGADDGGDLQSDQLTWLQEILERTAGGLAGPDHLVEHLVEVGRPSTVICEQAREMDADVIVVGSRGRGPIATALLGSVSAEVVDHARRPVLVARRAGVSRILLAHDGSTNALAAEELLEMWPILQGVPVDVISVAPSSIVAPFSDAWDAVVTAEVSYPPLNRSEPLQQRRREQEDIAEGAARRLRATGRTAESVMPRGDPAHMIVRVAEEQGTDLIVVGTRGNAGLTRLVLGSVARKVLTHASCSVLVVPPRE